MRIAICEDDKIQAGTLEHLLDDRLRETECEAEVDVYFGVDDIKRELNNKHYDAYFLDIELGADNGVELAKNIKQSDINSIVVFTTSHTDYMAEAFDVHAFNYIVKPVTMQKVDKIVTQLEEVINSRDDKLIFRCNRELVSTYYASPAPDIGFINPAYISVINNTATSCLSKYQLWKFIIYIIIFP